MDDKRIFQEQISALVDGELAAGSMAATFAELRQAEGKGTWDVYHQIGDALRSDDMALSLSSDFLASFSARLDAEPTFIAPAVVPAAIERKVISGWSTVGFASIKRFAMPGLAVAASIAVFVVLGTPKLMVDIKEDSQQGNASSIVVASANTTANSQDVVLRDPQIDQYLLAHQRFSPSTYSIAQYARSANFATDSDK